jgi:hypothetical protein
LKLLLVGLALFPLLFASQERPSDAPIPKQHEGDRFIGEWKLNTEKSSRVGIESETIKIETRGSEYRFEYDQALENGTVLHWWFVTDMKGGCVKQTQKNGEPMSSQSCVLRLDANRFADNTLLAKYEYEVTRDGQRMTVHRTLLHTKATLVFDRAATSN